MKNRQGFTLVELLIVITILLLLSSLVFAVFKGRDSDKARTAARVGQSAFLGAKDRALHAKDLRGVRLIRDTTDPTLVTGFTYVQQLQPLVYPNGSIQLERMDVVNPTGCPTCADSLDVLIVRGTSASVDFDKKAQFFPTGAKIRIPS